MEANKKFNRGRIKFTFSDDEGVFASFLMNPTDAHVIARMEETAEYFEKRKNEVPSEVSGKELEAFNNEIEEKINYILGYDASSDIFAEVNATDISADGEVFAWVVLDFIAEKLAPEIERRAKKTQQAMAKYTAKYEK